MARLCSGKKKTYKMKKNWMNKEVTPEVKNRKLLNSYSGIVGSGVNANASSSTLILSCELDGFFVLQNKSVRMMEETQRSMKNTPKVEYIWAEIFEVVGANMGYFSAAMGMKSLHPPPLVSTRNFKFLEPSGLRSVVKRCAIQFR